MGSFERAAFLTGERSPFVAVVVLRLAGELRGDRLRPALDRLQREQPLLAVRVAETAAGPRFVTGGTPAIPLVEEAWRDDRRWLQVVEEELNRGLDATVGPLLRCRLLGGDGGRHDLVLAFHHAIVDGVSLGPLLDRLLALLATGSGAIALAPDPPEGELSGPHVEARLPGGVRGLRGRVRSARFVAGQLADELLFRLRRRGGRRPPVATSARCRPLPIALGEAETAALVRQTRRRRVTLNGALSAAMLLAVHRRLYGGLPRPLRHIAFADLRPYLDPPLGAEELGCCISMLRHTLRLPAEAGFWPLAAEITRQVDRGSRRGDKFFSHLLCETMMRATLRQRRERMAATAISYSGVTPLAQPQIGAPGLEPRVIGCHAFVSNLTLGPEYTAQARMLDGRLQLDVVYLDSDMDEPLAQALADDLLDTLRRAADLDGAAGGDR